MIMAPDQSNSQFSSGRSKAPPRDDHSEGNPRPRCRLGAGVAHFFKQDRQPPQNQQPPQDQRPRRHQQSLDNQAQIIGNSQAFGLLSPPRSQRDQLPTIPEDSRTDRQNIGTLQHLPQSSDAMSTMPTQHLQPTVHTKSASANHPNNNNNGASNSATHKKFTSSNDASKSTTTRIPSPKTPPGQSGPKNSDGYLSPSSQACESADVSPSQEGVKRSDRKIFHSPPGTAG